MSDIKDIITFVGSGIDSDSDINLLAKGDARSRKNIISGYEYQNGSLTAIKGNFRINRSWTNKTFILESTTGSPYNYFYIPFEESYKGFLNYTITTNTGHGQRIVTFNTASYSDYTTAFDAFYTQVHAGLATDSYIVTQKLTNRIAILIDAATIPRLCTFTGSTAQGTNTVIESTYNEESGTEILFYFNQYGQHSISEFNPVTDTFTDIIYREYFLNFSLDQKPDGAKVIGTGDDRLLVWVDNNAPRKVNLYKATRYTANLTGRYAKMDAQTILVVKTPPYKQPTVAYASDTNYQFNNLRGKTFKFCYAFKYDDNEYSVASPYSVMAIPQLEETIFLSYIDNIILNNRINITFPNSYHNVTHYILYVRNEDVGGGVPGNWFKYDEMPYSGIGISYAFYNDKQWQAVDNNDISRSFDYVPQKAICQEVLNGNQIVYGGITEGYDNVSINVALEYYNYEVDEYLIKQNTSTLFYDSYYVKQFFYTDLTDDDIWGYKIYKYRDIGIYKNCIRIYPEEDVFYEILGRNINYRTRYLEDSEDNRLEILTSLYNQLLYFGDAVILTTYDSGDIYAYSLAIPYNKTGSVSVNLFNAKRHFNKYENWKRGNKKYFGLVYYDEYGNRSGGVNVSNYSNIYINQFDLIYNNNIPIIKWFISNQPPAWAFKYQWVVSKSNKLFTQRIIQIEWPLTTIYRCAIRKFYIGGITPFIDGYEIKVGDIVSFMGVIGGYAISEFAGPISNIFGGVIGYIDDIINFTIIDEDAEYYYIDNINYNKTLINAKFPLSYAYGEINIVNDPDHYLWQCEIYRNIPIGDNDELLYHEFGECYDILDPGLSTRRHQRGATHSLIPAGTVTDQSSNYVTPATGYFRGGDSYLAIIGASYGTSAETASDSKEIIIESNAISGLYDSRSLNYGRPNIVDPNIKQKYMDILRWGGKFVNGSQINYINKFVYDDLIELNSTYGNLYALEVIGYTLKALQAQKSTSIYIGVREIYSADGGSSLATTDSVLGNVKPSSEKYGTVDPDSVQVYARSLFFYDRNSGAVIRDDPNGQDEITDVRYKVHTLFTQITKMVLEDSGAKILAGFDKYTDTYFITFKFTNATQNITLGFNVKENRWKSYYEFYPTFYSQISQNEFLMFNGEYLYKANSDLVPRCNFFGTQYYPEIDIVSNINPVLNKIFKSIEINSNVAWGCPDNGDIMTNYNDYLDISIDIAITGGGSDFTFEIPFDIFYYKYLRVTKSNISYVFDLKNKVMNDVYTFLDTTFTTMLFTHSRSSNVYTLHWNLPVPVGTLTLNLILPKDAQICSSRLKKGKFVKQEGIYRAAFERDMGVEATNTYNLVNGRHLIGKNMYLKLTTDAVYESSLFTVTINSDVSK